MSKFVTSDLIKSEIEEKVNDATILSLTDKFYNVKLTALKAQKRKILKQLKL